MNRKFGVFALELAFIAVTASACVPGLSPAQPYGPPVQGPESFAGRKFCQDVESSARENSIHHRTWAWVTGIASLAAAGTGVGVAATDQPDSNPGKNRYKVAVVTLPLVAGALAYLASGQFSMADNASNVASTAANTVGTDNDKLANTTCNSAIGTWDADSASASAAFAAAVAQQNQAQKEKKDAAIQQKAADDATQKAQDAAAALKNQQGTK